MNNSCSVKGCKSRTMHHGFMFEVWGLIVKLNLCQKHFDYILEKCGYRVSVGRVQ